MDTKWSSYLGAPFMINGNYFFLRLFARVLVFFAELVARPRAVRVAFCTAFLVFTKYTIPAIITKTSATAKKTSAGPVFGRLFGLLGFDGLFGSPGFVGSSGLLGASVVPSV